MPIPTFTLLLIDAAGHTVLIADGPSGEILAELPLPPACTPVDLAVTPNGGRAYLALATSTDSGALCGLVTGQRPTLESLPVVLPRPARLAVSPDGRAALIADPAGDLYSLDLSSLILTAWGRPPGSGACAGLAAGHREIYGAWETDGGGVIAAYSPDGRLVRLSRLGGIPTGLTAAGGRLLVPFTASPFSGEGLVVYDQQSGAPTVLTIHCSRCAASAPASPIHAAAAADGGTVYLACEDSAGVIVIDLAVGDVSGFIPLGRSVSRLALVPGDRFAVAASNANADLCLIDLVNRRPLAITATKREILAPLAVID